MAPQKLHSYIYIFGIEGGPSKVGQSLAPTRRMKQVQAECGEKLMVMGTWPVGTRLAMAVERYVHWLLRERHIHGEWFDAPRDEIKAAIEKALTTGVDPNYPMPYIQDIATGRGNGEHIYTRFPKGTRERFRGLLGPKHHGEFVRGAVLAELDRRERESKRKP